MKQPDTFRTSVVAPVWRIEDNRMIPSPGPPQDHHRPSTSHYGRDNFRYAATTVPAWRRSRRPFLEGEPLLALDLAGVLERRLERPVEPVGQIAFPHADGFEVGHDRIFEFVSAPTNSRVIVVRIVVRAPVVIVRAMNAPQCWQVKSPPTSGMLNVLDYRVNRLKTQGFRRSSREFGNR
jgi:hypothetical protein